MISLDFEIYKPTKPGVVNCNFCRKEARKEAISHEWLKATIFPFEDETPVTFIVCTDQCRTEFVSQSNLDYHIMLAIVLGAASWDKKLNDQFMHICKELACNE